MSPSGIYTLNMFLSRPQDKPGVELTAAAEAVSEMAQVGDPSCSQSGCVRNFDINRLPSGEEEEEEELEEETGGSSSAVSIVSPFLSPLSNTSDKEHDHTTTTTTTITAPIHVYTAPASREEEEEGDGPGVPPRKKLRLSKEQSALLEESFREHHTLNPKQKSALAKQLNLKSRQVEVWFQNRRARTKLKQTEVDCEFLKRCCESLTEENRRLQREVEELRAIKVAPPACLISAQDLYMPMTMPMPMPLPAATLTMCPSCERMGTTIDKRALTFAKPSYYVTNFRQPSAAC
ncbi:homeobox-leucine zipper protein HOX3 [Cryptomeria japonica]|uniref:homeobox-leucine zipper protein HOX3 n=1 Tax=Cryptomeria japonica TaxID=3369 RepID=UPI0027DA1AB8|nr:homeobox-leucine zipper protein HOX3 [Cryptomeria japonica]